MNSPKRLTRSRNEKMIAGVCGGLAEFFEIDPTLVRAGYVVFSLLSAAFPGLIVYIVLAFVIPQD
jgi:phage shock protein C